MIRRQTEFELADVIDKADDPVTVMEDVAVQLFKLVTVTVKIPAANPVMFCVVWPLLQTKV